MQKLDSKPSKLHSKSKPTLHLSPKLSLKPVSCIPSILVQSLDSNQIRLKSSFSRPQTPSRSPPKPKCLKRSFGQNKLTLDVSQRKSQKQVVGKSTVKLKINLYEGGDNGKKESNGINSKLITPRRAHTPKTKVISFNLEQLAGKNSINFEKKKEENNTSYTNVQPPVNSKPSSISNIPLSTLNLTASIPTTNAPSSSNSIPTQQNSLYPPSAPPMLNPAQLPSEQKALISLISQSFAKNRKSPASSPNFYRTKQPLGKGSFGKVLLCIQILTGKPVAIKVIEKSQLKNSMAEKRVLQEIQIIRKLDHKNVVKLLEVFETETAIYLVMEYLDRGDLYTLLKSQKKGRLSEPQTKSLFSQLLRGLEYIHSQGILHRDIKLDNVLLDQNMNLKICDFGISRTVINGHRMSEQSGTPAFMAPEIVAGMGYEGFASDAWSLGVVVYCLLTGTLPFRGNSAKELNQNILKGAYNTELNLSPEAKSLLSLLLELSPEKRIKIKEIPSHPWISSEISQEETVNLLPQKSLHEETLNKLESFGFPRDFIVKSLENKGLGHVNACYHSLLH